MKTSYFLNIFTESDTIKLECKTLKQLKNLIKIQIDKKTNTFDVMVSKSTDKQLWYYDHTNNSVSRYNYGTKKSSKPKLIREIIRLQRKLRKLMLTYGV